LIGGSLAEGDFNHVVFKNSVTLAESEKFLELFKLSNKPKKLHKQYQAIGKYNNSSPITTQGEIIREIETSGYLNPNHISIQEKNSPINFNNWNKEKSVYLQLSDLLPNLEGDNSRIRLTTSSSSVPVYSEECFEWNIVTTNAQDNRFTLRGINCRGEGFYIKEFKNDAYNQTICAKEILVDEADGFLGFDVKVRFSYHSRCFLWYSRNHRL
jgi:hypothetical protein